jgi:hypothetical protein
LNIVEQPDQAVMIEPHNQYVTKLMKKKGIVNLFARTQSQTEDDVVLPPLSLKRPKLES